MAIFVKNTKTNETERISGIKVVENAIVPKKGKLGSRFIEAHSNALTCIEEDGKQVFVVNEGWELVSGGRKATEPKPVEEVTDQEAAETTEQEAAEATPQPEPEQPDQPEKPRRRRARKAEAEATAEAETGTPTEEAATEAHEEACEDKKVEVKVETSGLHGALEAAFTPVFAGVAAQIEANVRSKVQAEIDALKAQAKTHVTRIELAMPTGEKHDVEGVFCDEFEDMVEDVNNGWSPYLWGAAGCGKSHTCEQIAKALGLDYYTQNMLNFAHEIAGYGNAAGEFVSTPFFEAFSKGGLFHLDEADRSQIEGLVTLNQALQQGVFNFPVIGNVKAHPKFRFICSGNTTMNGADEMYTSGQTQDASFKRRVIFYEMHYDRRIELPIMAQGDEELVNFVEDVRQAIKSTGTLHFVSYTETKYMKQHENKKEKALLRSTFKSLDIDIIRQIYGALQNKENEWAKALYNIVK